MASYNNTLFISVLVAISALMAAAPSTAIVISLTPPLSVSDMIIIQGVLYCEINLTLSPNGIVPPSTPTFPNAVLQLRCDNMTLATTTTNTSGIFGISLVPALNENIQALLSFLTDPASNCKIVVTTPLASCNATLPSNVTNLVSTLLPGPIENFNGLFRIFNILLGGFRSS